ncbi:hypothetical protein MBEHAL_0629 [Halarchaeum acidiphilum MH1-52-1]|uniref:Uncharacterized protein n=1 Tax=Halarchaeum acidiphilum MH1-52-1 TaxID=1261545 RepID=U3A2K7_9EURY|nr:DUF5790 family protein [Halarchaeum acidiphilum]GAD51869.1 hypothetical protein MBEHAL_0629 [Halarchaeum acidiphilum MH1-52-1]
MSQSGLDDEELFGEAATEIRADVEDHLASARDALPEASAVWDVEADNTLGVLNGLRTALAVDEVQDHLRDAKKWYTIGERADAFEDAADLENEIEAIEDVLDDLEDVSDAVGDLASAIPELRGELEEIHAEGDEGEVDEDDDA